MLHGDGRLVAPHPVLVGQAFAEDRHHPVGEASLPRARRPAPGPAGAPRTVPAMSWSRASRSARWSRGWSKPPKCVMKMRRGSHARMSARLASHASTSMSGGGVGGSTSSGCPTRMPPDVPRERRPARGLEVADVMRRRARACRPRGPRRRQSAALPRRRARARSLREPAGSRPRAAPAGRRTAELRSRSASTGPRRAAPLACARTPGCAGSTARARRRRPNDPGGCGSPGSRRRPPARGRAGRVQPAARRGVLAGPGSTIARPPGPSISPAAIAPERPRKFRSRATALSGVRHRPSV